ncbi:MAG: 23S rRNA (adenine(2503)-C(2))-methyltransferase RlmN [Clostridium sp.]|nr:23S rRNA (adenine(2503)-C(2))-methyltransferase RlmN [Prevotella sp.]MCM1428414.1 23S rRNA (adenine(2503)-C(2))-methyltransferase RlmN [Clostridium sp.]MCM1476255.1 23S rRNA (adenine(2503)-C(2))-methyltransferase RlmN [Muribaculaceae bacterium]
METLIGKDLAELQEVAFKGKMPKFVGKQLAEWIYSKRATDFSEMVNISKKNQQWLRENYTIGREEPTDSQRSKDGTVKYLFTYGVRAIESVYIPDRDRATLCVSSQSGCKMNCYFCATGKLGFRANLTAAQIINQILSIPPKGKKGEGMHPLTNIVFMGMGEPLDNYHEVKRVIDILTAPWGMAWSPKRITVSTVGKLPELKDLLDQTGVHVAISVHTADPSERSEMMPAQKAFSLQSVAQLLKGYDFSGQRRLSYEYIMWRGVNDDMDHARQLIRLIGDMPVRVNLIRFHKVEGVELHPCSEERMTMFRNVLNQHGITATIRASRGEDIAGACGQLAAGK